MFPSLHDEDEKTALRFGPATYTYRALRNGCEAYVAWLAHKGVHPGDFVAVWTQWAFETVVALVGNSMYGAVSVPLNPLLGTRELEHIMADARPQLVLAARPDEVKLATPHASPIAVSGSRSRLPTTLLAKEPLLVLYTSGTTGSPKGALLTAHNVVSNLDALARVWEWTHNDTVVHALPLFHVHGLVLGLFGTLRVGGTLDWLPKFDGAQICASLLQPSTMLFAVPTMYHRLIEAAEQKRDEIVPGLQNARLLISGSAGLAKREHLRIEKSVGKRVYERYGLTETLMNCAVRPADPCETGYVGQPLPNVELRLVDDERLPLDAYNDATLGEVAVRGPNVFSGYLHREDATSLVRDARGWFYTGDLATQTSSGAIRIVGRKSTDLIKTGGYKVGAGEIEACLLEDPHVREVAVVGMDDDDLGERIVAFIVPKNAGSPPSSDRLIQGVAHTLAPHKRPREIRFVNELPRNAMGKVMKKRLIEGPV